MTDKQLDSALDLMRRLPPDEIENNLADVIDLVPDLCEDLLSAVDQPLQVAMDSEAGKEYLLCDYNRDGDSYRSPWSNKYYDPEIDDGALPSDRLRSMEESANEVFDMYRSQYYEGGVSSAYFWELDSGFAACVLFHKELEGEEKTIWDAIHVIEVTELESGKATYKLTSTIILALQNETKGAGQSKIMGHMTRQQEKEDKVTKDQPHMVNMGRMIEDMESKMRNELETVYFGKTKEIVSRLRKQAGPQSMTAALLGEMNLKKH